MVSAMVEAIADGSTTILHQINFNPAIQHSSAFSTIQIKSVKSN